MDDITDDTDYYNLYCNSNIYYKLKENIFLINKVAMILDVPHLRNLPVQIR